MFAIFSIFDLTLVRHRFGRDASNLRVRVAYDAVSDKSCKEKLQHVHNCRITLARVTYSSICNTNTNKPRAKPG